MALVQCPECGSQISDKANACPSCGYPLNKISYGKKTKCPKCKSENVSIQREKNFDFGASTNTVVIKKAKRSKGCLYWLIIGWWWELIYFICFGFWKSLFLGGKRRGGLNFRANKTVNRTVGVCQDCGHTWKI